MNAAAVRDLSDTPYLDIFLSVMIIYSRSQIYLADLRLESM